MIALTEAPSPRCDAATYRIVTIAQATFRECIRGKILYTMALFVCGVVALGTLLGAFSIGATDVFMKDFALLGSSLFVVAFAVVSGASLLEKEISRKTIFTILSKSVSRSEFLIGKYLGMLLTVVLMLVLLGSLLIATTIATGSSSQLALLQAFYYQFLELTILCSAALLFSSLVVTPSLAGVFTLGLFLSGRSSDSILYFVNRGEGSTGHDTIGAISSSLLNGLYWVVPHLDKLYIGNEAAFGITQSWSHVVAASLYAFAYSTAVLMLAHLVFARRQFQ